MIIHFIRINKKIIMFVTMSIEKPSDPISNCYVLFEMIYSGFAEKFLPVHFDELSGIYISILKGTLL